MENSLIWEQRAQLLFDRFEQLRASCPPGIGADLFLMRGFKSQLVAYLGVREGSYAYRSLLGLPVDAYVVPKDLRPARDYAIAHAQTYVETLPSGEAFELPLPAAIGTTARARVRGVTRAFFVARWNGGLVRGRSAAVELDDCVLYDFEDHEYARSHDLFDIDPAFLAIEGHTTWVLHAATPREIPEAYVSAIGPFTGHFGDWLWLYVLRYLTALDAGLSPDIPVLIDTQMPEQCLEALHVFTAGRCRTIALAPHEAACVRDLWYASELFFNHLPVARLMPALTRMRAAVAGLAPHGSERIFLGRSATFTRHKLVNDAAIESLAAAYGFETVYLETRSFEEQVRTIKAARYILGPQGTAMTMSQFATAGTKLCLLTSTFIDPLAQDVPMYEFAGLDVTIFAGAMVEGSDPNDFYADFSIDERALTRFLDGWLNSPPET